MKKLIYNGVIHDDGSGVLKFTGEISAERPADRQVFEKPVNDIFSEAIGHLSDEEDRHVRITIEVMD